jgi:hypothetical protein
MQQQLINTKGKLSKKRKLKLNLTGFSVGYLTVDRFAPDDQQELGCNKWIVKCTCGNEVTLEASVISKYKKDNNLASCGCMRNKSISDKVKTHGYSKTPMYAVYRSMIDRCRLPTHHAWQNYGARGIKVCEDWQKGFINFWSDMKDTYELGLTLDRVDVNDNYCKENCRWTTSLVQNSNRRDNRFVQTPKGKMTIAQASREFGVNVTTLLYRLSVNCPNELLFDQPNYSRKFLI